MKKLSILLYGSIIFLACGLKSTPIEESTPLDNNFSDYWYQGKAEITSYKLEQARYGEIHQGTAVTVFVTEDFSKSKQVKLDYPQKAGKDAVKVMKLNFTKKFNTGIYPYSMMQSVFTPVDLKKNPNTLKLTTSSQEWCGHTFTQLNLTDDSYKVQSLSYFESEGDKTLELKKALTEDEIWNLIRIDPDLLPTGKTNIIPSLFSQRLRHEEFKVVPANASRESNQGIDTYTLEYPESSRKISIQFESKFPYQIVGWEESYKSGWGPNSKVLTTKATKINTLMTDYWSKNRVMDLPLREELGLE